MGSSFGHIAVKGSPREHLIKWLEREKIKAYVGPMVDGWVAFSDQSTDSLEWGHTVAYLEALTLESGLTAFGASVFDDDVLQFAVATKGEVVGRYESNPDYGQQIANGNESKPEIIGADALLEAVGSNADRAAVLDLLSRPTDFVFATELYDAVLRLLGLPAYLSGFGFDYAQRDDLHPRPSPLDYVG
jgi:hypothetical protein